jgi:tetratricopeptide (TPR) repeat protein
MPAAEGHARAREAVERALAIEPDLPLAHLQLGWLRMYHDWDWRGAEASLARALATAGGEPHVSGRAGVLAMNLGRHREALELLAQAAEQDPLSGASHHNLGVALIASDRAAEAEAPLRKALELTPQRVATRAYLAVALLAQGREADALAEADREPEPTLRLWALATLHHQLGHRAESDAALRQLTDTLADESAYNIAEVHAVRGEADQAFAWLDRAYAQRDPGLAEFAGRRELRPLHADPRWAAFLKRMGRGD